MSNKAALYIRVSTSQQYTDNQLLVLSIIILNPP